MKADAVRNTRVLDAAAQPVLSAGSVSLRRSRIPDHHLPHRSAPRCATVVPKPLEIVDPIVKYEFIRMPDSTGFGDYTESGQVIPVRFDGEMGGYVHCHVPRRRPADRRRPRALGISQEARVPDTARRTRHAARHARLRPGPDRDRQHGLQAQGRSTRDAVLHALDEPGFLLKIIPHVDGTPRICELVRYRLGDIA